jgi:uncharacterized membrane protein
MKQLSDEEQGILWAKIEQEQTGRTEKITRRINGEKPPASPTRVIIQFLAGLGPTCAGVVFGLAVGAGYGGNHGMNYESTGLMGIVMGCVLSVPISAYVIYRIGRSGNMTGSYLATLLGGVIGALAAGLTGPAVLIITPISSPIGAIIGFSQTRRYRTPQSEENTL